MTSQSSRLTDGHTPGPWTVHKGYDHDYDGWPVMAGGNLIAIAKYLGGTQPAKNNAHLIAIAPTLQAQRDKLVAILKRVAAWMPCTDAHVAGQIEYDIQSALRDAGEG